MITAILLALFTGGLIALSRIVNGTLGRKVGPMRSSFWNHIVGFGFMSLVLAVVLLWKGQVHVPLDAPFYAWMGGVFGVAFVAINSHVIVRLGASSTTSLVVGAQMLTGVALSSFAHPLDERFLVRLAGAFLVIAGIVVVNRRRLPVTEPDSHQGLISVPK